MTRDGKTVLENLLRRFELLLPTATGRMLTVCLRRIALPIIIIFL